MTTPAQPADGVEALIELAAEMEAQAAMAFDGGCCNAAFPFLANRRLLTDGAKAIRTLAASEGEDGAVEEVERIDAALFSQAVDEYGDDVAMLIDFMGMGSPEKLEKARNVMRAAIRAYTRPAAQVAATPFRNMPEGATFEEYRDKLATGDLTPIDQMAFDNMLYDLLEAATPKHDEGREALTDHGKRALKLCIEELERLITLAGDYDFDEQTLATFATAIESMNLRLATQPAARRVTDEDVEKSLAAYWRVFETHGASTGADGAAMRAALESFAQPAEGVSRADRNFPGDAEHENGDYENQCVQCGEVFIGYKRRVVCRVCAEKRGDTP